MDPESGIVRIEKSLDYEALPNQNALRREEFSSVELHFLVMALDRGVPSKKSFANLTIILDDINDNAPRCLHDLNTVGVFVF